MTIDREEILNGKTVRVKTGCGYMYITVNQKGDKPFEVFLEIGKAGGCVSSQSEALGRLVSLCLRNNIDVESYPENGSIEPHKLFGNPKVRIALTHAINRELIVDEFLKNYGKVASGPISPIFIFLQTA